MGKCLLMNGEGKSGEEDLREEGEMRCRSCVRCGKGWMKALSCGLGLSKEVGKVRSVEGYTTGKV